MATVKSYSDLEQSKKLAETLPLESADMCYLREDGKAKTMSPSEISEILNVSKPQVIPCWSLAALLDVIPWGQVNRMTNSNKWEASSWKNSNLVPKYYVEGFDNPTDACYELILKLHELNLL